MIVPSIKHKPANKPGKPLQQKHKQVFLLLQFFSILVVLIWCKTTYEMDP